MKILCLTFGHEYVFNYRLNKYICSKCDSNYKFRENIFSKNNQLTKDEVESMKKLLNA